MEGESLGDEMYLYLEINASVWPSAGTLPFVSPSKKTWPHSFFILPEMPPQQMDEGWSGRGRGKRKRRAARKVRAALTNRDKTGK